MSQTPEFVLGLESGKQASARVLCSGGDGH